jgi:hypothetical protein
VACLGTPTQAVAIMAGQTSLHVAVAVGGLTLATTAAMDAVKATAHQGGCTLTNCCTPCKDSNSTTRSKNITSSSSGSSSGLRQVLKCLQKLRGYLGLLIWRLQGQLLLPQAQ